MTQKSFFVTGTDTEVGKTRMSCAMLSAAKNKGFHTVGFKPIASGCEIVNGELHNEDALALQQTATIKLPYKSINPFAFREAIAPHLAARLANVDLSVKELVEHFKNVSTSFNQTAKQFTLIEGAGGWFVPLNTTETLADFVSAIQVPVILVVNIRLGCINHALLTEHAILNTGLVFAGWIANCATPDCHEKTDIIVTLKNRLRAPCLGEVPYSNDQDLSQWINLTPLLA